MSTSDECMYYLGIYCLHKNGGKSFGLSYTVLSYILKEKELRLETSMANLMKGNFPPREKISMYAICDN